MHTLFPLVVAAFLAKTPEPAPPPRTAVQIAALLGGALVLAGVGFELTGRVDVDLPERTFLARGNSIGGVALVSAGFCVLTLAALLMPAHRPAVALSVSPAGALVLVGGTFP